MEGMKRAYSNARVLGGKVRSSFSTRWHEAIGCVLSEGVNVFVFVFVIGFMMLEEAETSVDAAKCC